MINSTIIITCEKMLLATEILCRSKYLKRICMNKVRIEMELKYKKQSMFY